jgi:hypothetical protein
MSPEVVRCVLLADRHHGLTEGMCGLLKTAFEAVVDLSLTPGLTSSPVLTPLWHAARSKPKDAAIRGVEQRSLMSER